VTGIERVTRNWLLVRVFRTNNKEFYRLSHNALNYAGHSIKAHTFANLAGSIPPLLGIFLLVLLIYINIEILHSSSSIIISFLYLFFRLVQTLSIAAGSLGSMSRFFNHAQITAQYLDTFSDKEISKATDSIHSLNVFGLSPSGMTPSPAMNPSPNQTGAPTIAMQKISFSYAEGKPHILEDFSFDLKAGEHLGLVGKSGSGKSTLLAILLGVLSPKKGRVQIAGLEARDYFQNFADRIGFVGSEPFLIEGSIKDNLDYGSSRTYSGDEYRKALESASLYTFVDQLPERLNYKIEENGSGLSAGQKQRLALARALLREPLFLVLDEMTANLDQETELEITTGLATLKGKTTVMIVSHRKETLRFVDRILEL
nr:ATP-binding cassette domain-containing protein [Oligoflexales bacterium]